MAGLLASHRILSTECRAVLSNHIHTPWGTDEIILETVVRSSKLKATTKITFRPIFGLRTIAYILFGHGCANKPVTLTSTSFYANCQN